MAQATEAATTVVNKRHRSNGEERVYIGRGPGKCCMNDTPIGKPGWLGNPYIGRDSQNDAIEMFREAFLNRIRTDPEFKAAVLAIRGKALECWCKPAPCHGDVIAEWIDSQPLENTDGN